MGSADLFVITINGKIISTRMQLTAAPAGVPVRVTGRLRGGGQQAVKRLKELLASKGVAERDVQSCVSSIVEAIGESGVQESFATFHPWQSLKAPCRGKVRPNCQAGRNKAEVEKS